MNIPDAFRKRDLFWDAAILATAAAALLLNAAGLFLGITIILPLLVVPVVIAANRYPRWGIIAAISIGTLWFLTDLLITGSTSSVIAGALVLTGVMVLIGWLVGRLTLRLREQEALYKGTLRPFGRTAVF